MNFRTFRRLYSSWIDNKSIAREVKGRVLQSSLLILNTHFAKGIKMKKLVLVVTVLFSALAFAATDEHSSPNGPHNVAATLGFGQGAVSISGAYEYMFDPSMGGGGYLRIFPKQTSGAMNDGLTILGANLGFHFYKKNWDLSFAPGLAIINIDSANPKVDDVTTLGPSLSVGILYQNNNIWAVGFDNSHYYAWFNSDHRGQIADDLSVKVRATF
jgi:hypothetical protein